MLIRGKEGPVCGRSDQGKSPVLSSEPERLGWCQNPHHTGHGQHTGSNSD